MRRMVGDVLTSMTLYFLSLNFQALSHILLFRITICVIHVFTMLIVFFFFYFYSKVIKLFSCSVAELG